MIKILVIDDDIAICELIKVNLELAGYKCIYATDPLVGFALARQERPNLIILDVMMGEVNGYDVALKIRQNEEIKDIPIIILTALGELNDKLKGFSSGVDDYLTKPFEIEELKARVLAVLNRTYQNYDSMRYKEILNVGDITLIPENYEVKILDKIAELTPTEFEILNLLVQKNGAVVSLNDLLKEIWGYMEGDNPDIIRVHIKHLRNKIDKIKPEGKNYIKTVYGGGYKLIPDGVSKE